MNVIEARPGVYMSNGVAIGPSIGVQVAGRRGGPKFLFRDDFLTDEAAPLASPRTAEPGPGGWNITDTGSKASTTGGKLTWTSGSANFNPALTGDELLERMAGRTLLAELTVNTNRFQFGWASSADSTLLTSNRNVWFDWNGTALRHTDQAYDIATLVLGTEYQFALILRSSGAWFAIKGGAYTNWTLLWVRNEGTTANLTPFLANIGTTTSAAVDTARVLDLPAPFNTDYGLATDRLAGAVSVGQTFTHEANCVIEWTQTALPTNPVQHRILFRFQDEDNHWHARVTSAGNFELYERVGGSLTLRGVASGVVSAGHRCVVICDGTTIRGYSNNVLQWTYSSATNFATATGGQFETTGSSIGTVSDLVIWPRTLSGQAAALLDKAIA